MDFLWFSEYFPCLVSIFWNFLNLFLHRKNIFQKKQIVSFPWAEPEGPMRSTPLRPSRGPLEPIRAQALASHGQHGLSTAAAFLGVRATPRGHTRPYKVAAKPPRVPCSQAAASTAPRHPCVRRRPRLWFASVESRRSKAPPPWAPRDRAAPHPPFPVTARSRSVVAPWTLGRAARALPPAGSGYPSTSLPSVSATTSSPRSPPSPALLALSLGRPRRRRLEPPNSPSAPFQRLKKAPAVLQLGPYPFM
jgi:hypothetical protein